MKIKREKAGFYYVDNYTDDGDTLHIFQISKNLWGYNIGKSMTKGTYKTLREAKNALIK